MKKEKLENFDHFADDYETILDKSLKLSGESGEYFAKYKAEFVSRMAGKGFSGKVLDYGCGVGLLSNVLLKYLPLASVDGYDVSVKSIEQIPRHLTQQGSFTSDLNLLGQGYDFVVIANVMHHIESHEREGVIGKLKKLLKDEGRIIIFEHNPFNPLTRKTVKESPLDKGVVLLPFSETAFYLKTAGFNNVHSNYIVFFPKFLSALRWSEPYLSWFPLGAQYAAMGQLKH